jgi:hypothetical protein
MAVMVEGFHTPVLLNVFNRPKETALLVQTLKAFEPPVIYVHCDGPREGVMADVEKVDEVRRLVKETITWPCKSFYMFEEENLGCGRGPAAAMTWFFSCVDEGIILEDDCVPNRDFFMYCQELLEKYRNVHEIGIISGTCFSSSVNKLYSYRFSAYAGIWGWATWKRTWNLFDFDFSVSDKDFFRKVYPFVKSRDAVKHWLGIMHKCIKDGPSRTYWDYQLHLCMLFANKINILPNYNLITNIGFNENASHTFDSGSKYADRPTATILPLRHPDEVKIDHKRDNKSYYVSPVKKVKRYIKKCLKTFA